MVRPILARAGFLKEPTAETHETLRADSLRGDRPVGGSAEERRARSCRRLPTTLVRIRPRGLHVRWRLLASGEELKTRVLLSILKKEKDLESRLVAILALQYASEHATTGAKLVECCSTIRTSRFRPRRFVPCAARGPAALPKLKKVVDKFDARQGYFFVLETLALSTREANAILVHTSCGPLWKTTAETQICSTPFTPWRRRLVSAGARRAPTRKNSARAGAARPFNGGIREEL